MPRKPPKPGRTAKPPAPAARKPGTLSYELSSLVAQIALKLVEPRRGSLTVDEILGEFSFEQSRKRSVQRYLASLRLGVFNGEFHPALLRLEDRHGNEVTVDEDAGLKGIVETRIDRVKLVTSGGGEIPETPVGELLPIYMAYTVLRYLDGIIPREQVSTLWQELARKAGPQQSVWLTSFEQKFFSVPYAPKNYGDPRLQQTIADVIDALLRQQVLQIRYYGLKGEGKDHRFEPYTLAMYKGGLYLLGKSDRHDDVLIYLAVERIDSVEKLLDADGRPVGFQLPPGYSPDGHFQGVFGIIEGAETRVELEIQNEETEARLRERIIHPSQKFRRSAATGGKYRKAVMSMTVRGTAELAMWIVGQGPYVKVLEPRSLRDEVERMLRAAVEQYRGGA